MSGIDFQRSTNKFILILASVKLVFLWEDSEIVYLLVEILPWVKILSYGSMSCQWIFIFRYVKTFKTRNNLKVGIFFSVKWKDSILVSLAAFQLSL